LEPGLPGLVRNVEIHRTVVLNVPVELMLWPRLFTMLT